MTGDAPNWFAKVGPWTALLCTGLLVMAAAGVLQIVLIRQMASEMAQFAGYELPGIGTYVAVAIGSIIIRMALFFVAVGLLATQFRRSSVMFTIVAIWFVYPVLPFLTGLLGQAALAEAGGMAPASTVGVQPLDLAMNIVVTAYLLFSRRVAELYSIDTRTRIPATLRKGWAQLRGRPIPEEIEASRLHETFK